MSQSGHWNIWNVQICRAREWLCFSCPWCWDQGTVLEKRPEIPIPSPAVTLAAPVGTLLVGMATSPGSPRCPWCSHATAQVEFGGSRSRQCPWWRRLCCQVLAHQLGSYLLLAPRSRRRGFGRVAAATPPPGSTLCQTLALALAALLLVSPAGAWAGFAPSLNQQVILLITDKAPLIKEEVLWQVPQSLAWGNGEMQEQEFVGMR